MKRYWQKLTKREWYDRGGFTNPKLFRRQPKGGGWEYYQMGD